MSLLPALLLALGAATQPTPEPDARPNVVVVISDDQGWGDLSAHGNPTLRTPRLDEMRGRAVRFERFYADPLCAPTRAALLTGRYPLRTGVRGVTRGGETMRAEEVTIAEALGEAGYETGAFGKWHNGAHYPQDARGQGFGTFFGFSEGHANAYFDPVLDRDGEEVPTRGYVTDVVTDAAVAFMGAPREAPYLAWVAYNTPHAPFQVPDADYDRYAALGLDPKLAAIYGMVENLDRNTGRILDAARSDDRDTIVVFLSDNGPNGARYNDGLKGTKGGVDEGSIRVPMFVLLPGQAEGRRVEAPAAHVDLLPTLLGLLGLEPPRGVALDGVDLSPLLLGEEGAAPPERLLFAHRTTDEEVLATPGTVRDARYRAVLEEGATAWRLYDLAADPGQTRDLAEAFPERTGALASAWEAWFADVTRRAPGWPDIEVGHEEAPVVTLPAHEAHLSDLGARYGEPHGWSHDWITGWGPGGHAEWRVAVVRPGRYEAVLQLGGEGDAEVALTAGGASLERRLRGLPAAPVLALPDRIPRKEAAARGWSEVSLGTLALTGDADRVVLRVDPASGARLDVKGLVLERVGPL